MLKRPGEPQVTALTYNNLGVAYYRMGETDKAIEHYEKGQVILDRFFTGLPCE
jgi:tetratricopeptide (TPR) repeat protein